MPADPVLAVDNIVEVTFRGTSRAQGQLVLNRHYYIVTGVGAPPVDKLSDLLTPLYTNFDTVVLPIINTDFQLDRVEAKRVSGITALPAGYQLLYDSAVMLSPVATFGQRAGAPTPSFISASVWLQTGFVGRNWRGGIRWGTMTRTDIEVTVGDTNKWTAAYWALLQGAAATWTALFTTPGGTNLKMGVLSVQYWGSVVGQTGPGKDAFAPITNTVVSRYVRHQDTRDAPHVP